MPDHKICGCVLTCTGDREHEPRIAYCAVHLRSEAMHAVLKGLTSSRPGTVTRRDYMNSARALVVAIGEV